MNKILISGSKIVTKNSISRANPDIDLSTWKKYQEAFSDPNTEYVLTIQPKDEKTIVCSTLAPKTFSHLQIKGKLILNINKINNFYIDMLSNYLLSKNLKNSEDNNINTINYNSPSFLFPNIDYLFNKEMEINANNLNLSCDAEHEEFCDTNEITLYKRDILPLESLTINCNQARIKISNQDIKQIIINNSDPHFFNLILKNLFKLEYLDISNVCRFDLKEFYYSSFKQADKYESRNQENCADINDQDVSSASSINYFNIECINPNCIIKLNSETIFYFPSLHLDDLVYPIPIANSKRNYNQWIQIYLGHLFNIKNKKTIKVKWKTLQEKLLLKINEITINSIQHKNKAIKSYFKNINKQINTNK